MRRHLKTAVPLFALLCISASSILPQKASALITARYAHSATLLPNGNILIIGGLTTTGGNLINASSSTEILLSSYRLYSGIVPSGCGTSLVRSSHTATVLPTGNVLITGGVGTGPTVLNTAVVYNPLTNTCAAFPNMATARFNHTATLLPNGKVLIAGGQTDMAGTVTNTSEIFDPGTGLFSSVGSMGAARAGHTATLLYNNLVFAAGGYNSAGQYSVTTELFNSNSLSWTPGPAMIAARAFHTATVMGNRFVLLAGGFNGLNLIENRGILDSAEVYNPVSNSMMPPPPAMEARRMMHSAVLQSDGTVGLYGGLGNITTSYMNGGLLFEEGSSLTVSTTVAGSQAPSTGTITSSNMLLTINTKLSVPVTGEIVRGQMYFYITPGIPSITLTDANVTFPINLKVPPPEYPADNPFAVLDGTVVTWDPKTKDAGKIVNQLVSVSMSTGTVYFKPQAVSSLNELSAAGSINIAGSPCLSGQSCAINGGTLTIPIDVPFPTSDLGGKVLNGTATIVGATINNATLGYAITLNGGVASGVGNFDGGTVTKDAQGNPHYFQTVTFNNLSGAISNSTTSAIASGMSIANQQVLSLQLKLQYVVSPIDLSGQGFGFNIATITVRSMIFSDEEIYNPAKNTWSFNPARASTPVYNHTAVLNSNGDFDNIGGRTCDSSGSCATTIASLADIDFIPAPNSFAADGPLSIARGQHISAVLPDGRVLVAGGTNGPQVLSSCELYDPKTKTWSNTGSMNVPRAGHTATLLPNGTVMVAGGFVSNNATGTTNTSEIFYPNTGQWVMAGIMVSSRQAHTATLLPDGTVLIAGGYANGAYLNTSEIFYSTSATWSPTPTNMTLAGGRADHTANLLQDGRVLLIGGINSGGPITNVEAYTPTTGQWAAVSSMPSGIGRGSNGRFAHTATLLRNGIVFIAGGDDGFGEILAPELYYPTIDFWQTLSIIPTNPTLVSGIDVGVPRLRHTAVLNPDGTVTITGGITASGSSMNSILTWDPDSNFWQELKGGMASSRGFHSSVLLNNGRILNIGGASAPGSYLATTDSHYYNEDRDASTPNSGFSRIPAIVNVDTGSFDRGGAVTVYGNNLKGMTEASGGGGASGNSSFNNPRFYLQNISESPSGFIQDVTTAIYTNTNNVWSNVDSSITINMPSVPSSLPYGWYHMRIAANSQFSDAVSVQAGPPLPTMQPGAPIGTMNTPSSVVWSWTSAAGCPNPGVCEGYHVYSSTNNVFLSTISAVCAGGVCQYTQSGLGSATVASIKIAAYNLSGDGPAVASTDTFITSSLLINGISGSAVSTGTILWSWPAISNATSYNVFSGSTGTLLAVVQSNGYTETSLAINSPYSITVGANTGLIIGPLTTSSTIYTLANIPAAGVPAVTNLTVSGFTTQWTANGNPGNTVYSVSVSTSFSTTPSLTTQTTSFSLLITGQQPNTSIQVQVSAVNGNGVASGATSIVSTYTLANPPINAVITGNASSSLAITWSGNSNPSYTAYQITISTDLFQTTVSTPIAFSSNYTSTSAILTGLLTGPLYSIRIVAKNQDGVQTAPAILSTTTNNGGGPLGSILTSIADPTQTTNISGTLGSGRAISLQIPSNAFSVPVTVLISSAAAAPQCQGNPAINAAISVTIFPPVEPVFPVQLSIAYSLADGITNPATLSIVRFDPASNACVPLQTHINASGTMAYANANHLSLFQLSQISPASDLSGLRIYPNPLYLSSQGYVTFDHLPANTRVRVFTLRGEELFDQQANSSGILVWGGTNKSARNVGSGIYIAVIEGSGQKQIKKLAVLR